MTDVVGLVSSSLTCLHGCVKGLIVLSKAKHYTRDVSDVRLQTELTLHSLFSWAEEAGLTQDPPTLQISANNAALVPGILGQLEVLLLDLNQLRQRYGLYLQPTPEIIEALYDEESTLGNMGPQQKKYTSRADIAIFRKRKEPWKRLRWVTLDDKKFDRLLDKVKGYIGEMERFLEQAKQERRDRYLELCLRDAVLNANGQQELGIIGKEYEQAPSKLAIVAAARLKQTRLKLGFSNSSSFSPVYATSSISPFSNASPPSQVAKGRDAKLSHSFDSPSKDMKLPMRLLTLSRAARDQILRTLALYDGRVVLLEWKNVSGSDTPAMYRRVNQVAAFLQELGPHFHSLQCRGFVRDHVSKRYGYIFDLPDKLHPLSRPSPSVSQGTYTTQPLPVLKTLRQVLDQSHAPPLNMRLFIAVTLLETLLNLHTSGWLHKELRSDNIIFIRKSDGGDAIDDHDLSAHSMYIAGYVYSRVDGPGEMTEPLESELDADLYRHPSLLGDIRESYHKSLDIFSVGCTLLEIGLWSSLRHILEHHSTTHPGIELLSSPSRSMSGLTLGHGQGFTDGGNENRHDTIKPSLDLMKLKHELLLSHLIKDRSNVGSTTTSKPTITASNRSMITSSLEAATGRLFASIVEEFLSAGNAIKDATINEHEYALDLELRARNTIQAIAKAV
jgi:hypothetical protein